MPASKTDGELDVTGGIVKRLIQIGVQALLLAPLPPVWPSLGSYCIGRAQR